MLNSKLYTYLKDTKVSKLAKLLSTRSVSYNYTSSANGGNLVFTIPAKNKGKSGKRKSLFFASFPFHVVVVFQPV